MNISLRAKKIIGLVLLIIIAAVFGLSAYTKLVAITPFEWSFIDLGFGSTLAAITARLMVGLEMIIALFLLLHVFLKRLTFPLALGVLILFSVYLMVVLITRGNMGNCGCFGEAFYMTPLEGLLKNLGLIVLLIILYRIYPTKEYTQQIWVASFITMLTLAGIFIALPMTKKAEKIRLEYLYEPKQREQPQVELRTGKHVVAFLSLTCPHCKDAAIKMQELFEQDATLPLYAVLNGKEENEESFIKETGLKFPHNRFKGAEEFVEMAGPYVPTIYYLNNGIREREIIYMELNKESIHNWLKN